MQKNIIIMRIFADEKKKKKIEEKELLERSNGWVCDRSWSENGKLLSN